MVSSLFEGNSSITQDDVVVAHVVMGMKAMKTCCWSYTLSSINVWASLFQNFCIDLAILI